MAKKLLVTGGILIVLSILVKLFNIMVPVILVVGGVCFIAGLIAKFLLGR